jgi:hypothetical protein
VLSFQLFALFTCILVNSYEIHEEFLKNTTSGLKEVNFKIKNFTYISTLPADFAKLSLMTLMIKLV